MHNRKSINTTKIAIILILIAVLLLPVAPLYASADMGPKDNLKVYVTNPPDEEYYLDLLSQNLPSSEEFRQSNISSDELAELDKDMLDLLYSFSDEGWLPALTHGTGIPMFGSLKGMPSGDKNKHEFGYYGLPDTYRIIIVTKSGEVRVTEPYTRKVMQSSVTYDFKTGEVRIPSVFWAYITQFLITFTATLLIECAILLFFRYSLKKNWLVFLIANLTTQIFLTALLGISLIFQSSFFAFLMLVPIELIILAAESTFYYFFLKGKTKKRNILYGVVANLASWLIGFVSLNMMATFLIGLL